MQDQRECAAVVQKVEEQVLQRFTLLIVVVLAVASSSCASGDDKDKEAPITATPTESPGDAAGDVKLELLSFGSARRDVIVAVRILKRIKYWDDLTRGLGVVSVHGGPGARRGPYGSAFINYDDHGKICSIALYPGRVRHNLRENPALRRREFWTRLLAHELAHCLGDGRGEGVAYGWGRRVGRAMADLRR